MRVPRGNRDILKFFQKMKNQFINVCRDEVQELNSVKVQFKLLVRFSINRNGEVEHISYATNCLE